MDFLEFSDVSAEIKGSMVTTFLKLSSAFCFFILKCAFVFLDSRSFETNGSEYRV